MPTIAAVITVSDRSASGVRRDAGGPIAVEAFRAAGFDCPDATIVPDGAASVASALRAAIADPNPVVYVENKTLYFRRETFEPEEVPIGRARVVRPGRDVTVVALSRLVHEAVAAADELAAEGIEVEVVDLPGLEAAIDAGADIVLLDNMDDAAMAEAVRRARGRVLLEASGNMTLERLPRVAATGVEFVSMGAVTHSARAVDVSFELS